MDLSTEDAAAICRRILQATKAEGWQLGKSRVFLRAGQLALLEVSSNFSNCLAKGILIMSCLFAYGQDLPTTASHRIN